MMGARMALVLALLAVGLSGCTNPAVVQSTAWLDRLRGFSGPTGSDVVQMDVALIERPAGDAYLNDGLWGDADELVVAPDRKRSMKENGFRIGQIGGITPAGLQELLTSEHSCANPRRLRMHAAKPTTLYLGPPVAQCRFQLEQDGQKLSVDLDQADCTLEVVPHLTAEGRIRLQLTPHILHGPTALQPRPAPDRSGWMLQEQRGSERYDALGWEITLAANEYLVVGGRFDLPGSLGYESFVRTDGAAPVQRLLVIRAARLSPLEPDDSETPFIGLDEALPSRVPPLALQAVFTTVRGSSR